MAKRDPNRPQLDFPDLVAELITQLRLTGQIGLLDFSDQVSPVYIVAAREGALAFTASAPVFTSAGVVGTTLDNPAANAIIGDTGALAAGTYDIFASMSHTNAGGLGEVSLQHRNAANNATLANLLWLNSRAVDHQGTNALPLMGYTIGLNERFRFQNTGPAYAGVLGTVIGVQIRPTP